MTSVASLIDIGFRRRLGWSVSRRGSLDSASPEFRSDDASLRAALTVTEPMPPGRRGFGERAVEVPADVVDVLQADREADQVRADAGRDLLLVGQLLVGGAGRVDHQRLGVADVGQVRDQLQALR